MGPFVYTYIGTLESAGTCCKESLTRVGLNLYDFGARMFSPFNMRWMTMDPLAEKYYHISPYVYCAGNPINLVDPDGMDWYEWTDEKGNIHQQWFDSEEESYKDNDGNLWRRTSKNFLSIKDDKVTFFTQSKNDSGELCLNSTTYDLSDENSSNAFNESLGIILSLTSSVAGEISEIAKDSKASFRLTNSNGQFDFHFYNKPFYGNQYVTTTRIAQVGNVLKRAGRLAGAAGLLVSGIQFKNSTTFDDKVEHGLDVFMGAVGFAPIVGPGLSLYWMTIGKSLHCKWVNDGLIPQIQRGDNPGLMIYQPFK